MPPTGSTLSPTGARVRPGSLPAGMFAWYLGGSVAIAAGLLAEHASRVGPVASTTRMAARAEQMADGVARWRELAKALKQASQ